MVNWSVQLIHSCVYSGWITNLLPDTIAQLKVNLRPLWSPAAAALASLSQRFGDVVWKLLFEEVQKFTCVTSSSTRPEVAESEQNPVASGSNQNHDDPWEEERSWRDPSAHRLRSVVIDWDNIQSTWRMQVSLNFFAPFQCGTSFTHCPLEQAK